MFRTNVNPGGKSTPVGKWLSGTIPGSKSTPTGESLSGTIHSGRKVNTYRLENHCPGLLPAESQHVPAGKSLSGITPGGKSTPVGETLTGTDLGGMSIPVGESYTAGELLTKTTKRVDL